MVANLVFNIALLMTFAGIHKYGLETVVFPETVKAISDLASASPDDFGYDGFGVVKPQFVRHSADVWKRQPKIDHL
jgi:hypothetical protein